MVISVYKLTVIVSKWDLMTHKPKLYTIAIWLTKFTINITILNVFVYFWIAERAWVRCGVLKTIQNHCVYWCFKVPWWFSIRLGGAKVKQNHCIYWCFHVYQVWLKLPWCAVGLSTPCKTVVFIDVFRFARWVRSYLTLSRPLNTIVFIDVLMFSRRVWHTVGWSKP